MHDSIEQSVGDLILYCWATFDCRNKKLIFYVDKVLSLLDQSYIGLID